MSATAGWYPDPGGKPGLFRYWDGKAWSAATTQHPAAGAPPGAFGAPAAAPGSQPLGGGTSRAQHVVPVPTAARRSPVGWILGAVALVVVIALVVVGVRVLGGTSTTADDPPTTVPTGEPSVPSTPEAECPPQQSTATPSLLPQDGDRVTSGKLSYPKLGSPFSPVYSDSRVPFGTDVATQSVTVEGEGTKNPWAAAVVIATLTAGDGFYGPEQGAKLVARCIVGTFYGDNEVTRKDTSSKATTVDGHAAWLIEAQLSYDIPDIKATSELLLVLVVDTEDGNAGLFYGSVPNSASKLETPARTALAELRVS